MSKLIISKKHSVKGDDGHKVFSVRMKEDLLTKLDSLAEKSNRSRNEIINLLIEYAIDNCEIDE